MAAGKGQDKQPLGLWMCTALVVGNMIGTGEFMLPAALAPFGWNAVIGWLITIAGTMCLAFVFARLATALPLAGGPYAYAREAFGPMAGFAVAWTYWLGVVIGNAAIAIAGISYLSVIFPVLGEVKTLPAILSILVIWGFTAVNCLGARSAGRLQLVSTIIKVIPLAAVALIAAFLLARGEAVPSVPFRLADLDASSVMASAALTLWCLVGLESATVPTDKIRDPRRTIPRATLYGTAFVGLLYVLVCSSVQFLMPPEQLTGSAAPFADFLQRYVGGPSGLIIAGCAAFSGFSALNGWVMLQGELPRAMAEDGIFPRWFAHTTSNGTPVRAHLVSSGILTVTVLMNFSKSMIDLFTFVALLATTTALVAYLFAALAALKLQAKRALGPTTSLTLAAVLGAGYALYSIAGAGRGPMLWGGALFASAIVFYLLLRWVRRSGSAAQLKGTKP